MLPIELGMLSSVPKIIVELFLVQGLPIYIYYIVPEGTKREDRFREGNIYKGGEGSIYLQGGWNRNKTEQYW